MIKKLALVSAATFSLMAAGPANAQLDGRTAEDVDCMISLSWLVDQMEEKEKDDIVPLIIYYLGRVRGAAPQLDLESAMLLRLGVLSSNESALPDHALKCAEKFEPEGEELERIGARIDALDGK